MPWIPRKLARRRRGLAAHAHGQVGARDRVDAKPNRARERLAEVLPGSVVRERVELGSVVRQTDLEVAPRTPEVPDGEVRGWVRNPDGSLTREDFNADFIAGMRVIGYQGYTGFELCHPLPKVNGAPAGIDFVDYNARLAAKFMRQILAETATAPS